jgi:hypothetical protein
MPPQSRQSTASKVITPEKDAVSEFLSSFGQRRSLYTEFENSRLAKAYEEFKIADVGKFFDWHPFSETIPGLNLATIAQNMTTYGGNSGFEDYHSVCCNSGHKFTPETPEPLPAFFAEPMAKIPKLEDLSMFKPEKMQFEEETTVFYVSPFRVLVFARV